MVILGRCDENGTLINSVKLSASGSFITTKFDENPKYPYLCVNLYANNSGTAKAGDYVDYTDIQVEILESIADTPSDYKEHQNEIINLDLPEGMELYEGETIFKEEGKWYRDRIFDKTYITSSSVVSQGSTNVADVKRFAISDLNAMNNESNTTINPIYSNVCKATTANQTYSCTEGQSYNTENNHVSIYLEETKTMTADEFKAYCEEKGIYVVYKLAEPTKEEIKDTILLEQLNELTKLRTYKGVNTFFLTSAGADGLMKLEYRKFDIVGHEDIEELENTVEETIDYMKKDMMKEIFNIAFPIGSTYVTQKEVNPSTILGIGSWERIKGKVLVGLDENDTNFNEIGKTGGESTHKLTVNEMPSHNHGVTDPGHNHTFQCESGGNKTGPSSVSLGSGTASTNHSKTGITINNTGGGQAHNNLQPYQVVGYMWIRTA